MRASIAISRLSPKMPCGRKTISSIEAEADQDEAHLADLDAVHERCRGCSRCSTAWRRKLSVNDRIIQKIIEPTTGPQTRPRPPMIAAVKAKNVIGVA